MTRRNLLFAIPAAPAIGNANAAATSGAVRTSHDYTHTVAFPAAAVFPLLCPVAEYQWIEEWDCELVHSESGLAEDNCIFVTSFPDSGRQVWHVSRYEPNRRIEFIMIGDDLASRLNIRLEESGGRTTLHWTRMFTGLNPKGNQMAATHEQGARS